MTIELNEVVLELNEPCRARGCEKDCPELRDIRSICRSSQSGFVQALIRQCGQVVCVHDAARRRV